MFKVLGVNFGSGLSFDVNDWQNSEQKLRETWLGFFNGITDDRLDEIIVCLRAGANFDWVNAAGNTIAMQAVVDGDEMLFAYVSGLGKEGRTETYKLNFDIENNDGKTLKTLLTEQPFGQFILYEGNYVDYRGTVRYTSSLDAHNSGPTYEDYGPIVAGKNDMVTLAKKDPDGKCTQNGRTLIVNFSD